MTAPTQRVERLEAQAFRTGIQLEDVNNRLAQAVERLDHLTNAVGELSGDQRAFRHDVREKLAEIGGQLDELTGEQARHGEALASHGEALASQGALLAAIAQKLGVGAGDTNPSVDLAD